MSAHYKPYKNDPDAEQLDWADHDVGEPTIHIRRPGDWSPRGVFYAGIVVAILGATLGLSVGYFARTAARDCNLHRNDFDQMTQMKEDEKIRQQLFNSIDGDNIRNFLRKFSRRPRLAGTANDIEQATELKDIWTNLGVDRVDLASYSTLLSYPDSNRPNSVRIIDEQNREVFHARNREVPDSSDVVSAYAAYSPSGDVKADVVYCNYGQPSDFAYLTDKLQLNLTGNILMMRLGMLHIGDQVRNAEHFNAAAVLLYPDPQDFIASGAYEKVYPTSWWLPGHAIPRGSAINLPDGDPLTPGYPATDYAFRIPSKNTLPKIPVQMISYDDAYFIVGNMGGTKAPPGWQGGFNVTYNIGPGLVQKNWTLHMEIYNTNTLKRIYNVIGYIKGRTEPDRYILLGSHRDAWAYGAVDPASGTAVVTELARVFGRLTKQGWRPRRTIVFCSWDAQVFNLIGSTEWVEEHMKILQERAVAYINVDSAVTGNYSLTACASPLLYQTVFDAAQKVANPNRSETITYKKTVYDSWVEAFPNNRNSSAYFLHSLLKERRGLGLMQSEFLREAMENLRPRMRKLHGGTDYSSFFNQAGISSVDLSYGYILPGVYPLYHTTFDNFYVVENFIDPTFKYHEALTQIIGEILRDLSDSIFIPFNVLYYTQTMVDMLQTLQLRFDLIPQFKRDLEQHDIKINWLEQAVQNFTQAAYDFHLRQESLEIEDGLMIRRINDQLMQLERAFLDAEGLPGQPLHRHIIQGPSRVHTFGDDSFPGLVDLLTESAHRSNSKEHWEMVRSHLSKLIFVIETAIKILAEVA